MICFLQRICERSRTRWKREFAPGRHSCHCKDRTMGWERWRSNWGGWIFSWRTHGRRCLKQGWTMMNPEGNYTKLVSSHHRFYAAGSDSIYNIKGEKMCFSRWLCSPFSVFPCSKLKTSLVMSDLLRNIMFVIQ